MSKTKEIFMYALAGLISLGFFATAFYMIAVGKYESTIQLLTGGLLSAFGTVVGYFFGSSKSSADKNEMLNQKNLSK